MANKKRRRPQTQKSRSLDTRDFLLQHRGSRIPSATAYKRPKAGARVDVRSSEW